MGILRIGILRIGILHIGTAAFLALAFVRAQDAPGDLQLESGGEVAERVLRGGWFEESRHERAEDGALQRWFFADTGPEAGRFVPLIEWREDASPLDSLGILGFAALACQGPGDLLGMTDPEFHFGALGIGGDDASLRRLVAVTPTEGLDGVDLLDRQLAVATLLRRNPRATQAELKAQLARGLLAPPLADYALGLLSVAGTRRRLTPDALLLPDSFDLAVVIDHARLPDMTWLTPLARRLGATVTAKVMQRFGRLINSLMKNGAQRACDVAAEMPFELVRRHGNVRIDHSCLWLRLSDDRRLPFEACWQAAAEFDHERWQQTDIRPGIANVSFAPNRVLVHTGEDPGSARSDDPVVAELLRDSGAAVRIVVANDSKLLPMAALFGLPSATRAELQVRFDDVATMRLTVATKDVEAAQRWLDRGERLVEDAVDAWEDAPTALRDCQALHELVATLKAGAFSVEGSEVTAQFTVRDFTPAKAAAIALALLEQS